MPLLANQSLWESIAQSGWSAVISALWGALATIWIARIGRKEESKLAQALETHKSTLTRDNEKELAKLKSDLEKSRAESLTKLADDLRLDREKEVVEYKHRIEKEWEFSRAAKAERQERYREIVDLIAEFSLVASIARAAKRALTPDEQKVFERARLRAYGYLALHATQEEMDSYDALVEYLLTSQEQGVFEFARLRTLALAMINCFRVSYGVNSSPIEYRGQR